MRFLWVVILVLTVALTSAPAPAAQTADFDRVQFNAAQQAGRSPVAPATAPSAILPRCPSASKGPPKCRTRSPMRTLPS